MELLPILEPEETPKNRQWYVLVPTGAGPGVSVGHTCTFLPSKDGGKGRIVLVGGANPNGSFSESYIINLETHEWDIPGWDGLQARYEHCGFVAESDSLCVFAGAVQTGNLNCVQILHTSDEIKGHGLWKTVQVKGTPPSVRTYHTNSACIGDRLFVFSGGDAGATPVTDPQVHIFDTVSATWTQTETRGTPPTPRHGHVIAAVGTVLYIHGGMAGDKFYSDMFSLDTETMKWEKVKAKGDVPPGVAAHASVTFGKNIFIFGGLTSEGAATNSMFKFHCDKHRWTLMKFEGDLPPGRLDHSSCLVPWRVRMGNDEEHATQNSEPDVKYLCFVFGGMDTQGMIFNDCLVTIVA
ncbi:rab9 effector protein with kelch motifs isoform X2 [Triplophysa dalaica]|nr:rab9 effector protein with kelch motifs isoform X2 [Triplophysa dalaica]